MTKNEFTLLLFVCFLILLSTIGCVSPPTDSDVNEFLGVDSEKQERPEWLSAIVLHNLDHIEVKVRDTHDVGDTVRFYYNEYKPYGYRVVWIPDQYEQEVDTGVILKIYR